MGIRQNPAKAGIARTLEKYRFSGYRGYVHDGALKDAASFAERR
ncbi:hypothetical protein [Pelosinus fermentans]|nr:hypothetical protein [Pelosinus fermentans]